MKLTPAILSSWHPEKPLPDLIFAKCANKQITHVDDISVCVSLHKLDLSNNEIKKVGSLSGIRYCSELTWLNLQNNQLDVCPPFAYQDKDGLGRMENLLVLNLNQNEIERITPYIYKLKELKALILGHNKISKIENLESLANLNTLVLSYNRIDEVTNLTCLKQLTKLSIAHNNIRVFPDLRMNTELKELRLNNNRILGVPESIKYLPKLEILDIGNNLIKEFSDIENIGSLLHLSNLNLKGNPITSQEGYKEKVLELIPSLRILDGERFDPKFLERREKRKIFLEHKKKKEIAKKLGLGKKKKNTKNKEDSENKKEDEASKQKKNDKNDNKNNNDNNSSESSDSDDDSSSNSDSSDSDSNGSDNEVNSKKVKKINKPVDNVKTNKELDNVKKEIKKPIINKFNKKFNNSTMATSATTQNKFNINRKDNNKETFESKRFNRVNDSMSNKRQGTFKHGSGSEYVKSIKKGNSYFEYKNKMEKVNEEQQASMGNIKRKVMIAEDDFFVEDTKKDEKKSHGKGKDAKTKDGKQKKRKISKIKDDSTKDATTKKAKKQKSNESIKKSKENDEEDNLNRSGVIEIISNVPTMAEVKKDKSKNKRKEAVVVSQFNPGLWSAKKTEKTTNDNKESDDISKTLESKQSIWGTNMVTGWD